MNPDKLTTFAILLIALTLTHSGPLHGQSDTTVVTRLATNRAGLLTPAQQENSEIELHYRRGSTALQNGEWLEAVVAFEKVSFLDPEYKTVRNKLADAHFNLTKNLHAAANSKSSGGGFSILGWGFLLSILSVGALLVFSPGTRGRLYLMQGDFEKATETYAALLVKHPEKIRLNRILANLYLLGHRTDQAAIEVFEMTARLNLLPERTEQINSLMANHYLQQGRSDARAIEAMEKELNQRLTKLKIGAQP